MTKTLIQKMLIRVPRLLSGIGDDYFKKTQKQLGDKDIYEKVCNDPGPLTNTIHKVIEKIRKRRPECRYN